MSTDPTVSPSLWHPPSGWPVIEPGLVMAGFDSVMFVRMSTGLDERAFGRHLDELARAIDSRTEGERVGVIYDVLSLDTDAKRRQRGAEVLNARKEKLAKTTAGFAMVTPSSIARGVLQATFWIAPPPYPWTVTDSIDGALRWLAPKMAGIDPTRVARQYRDLLRERGR